MTEEQKRQFLEYGCVSRCIIMLAKWHGKPIAVDDYIARFSPKFPHWSQFCGMLSESDIVGICMELQIARHADSYRDTAVVRERFEQVKTSGVLMLTERDIEAAPNYHCSVVYYSGVGFRMVSPVIEGGVAEVVFQDAEFSDLADRMLAHFLILRCDR